MAYTVQVRDQYSRILYEDTFTTFGQASNVKTAKERQFPSREGYRVSVG